MSTIDTRLQLRLRPSLKFCEVGEIFVFLDIEQDRYFAFDERQSRSFSTLLENRDIADLSKEDLNLLHALQRSNYCSKDVACEDVQAGTLSEVLDDIEFIPQLDPSTERLFFYVIASFIECTFLHKTRHFKDLIKQASRWKQRRDPVGCAPGRVVTDTAERVLSATPILFRSEDACLFESFFLFRCLGRFGFAADWVFGVRYEPFAAHCWLEYLGIPLNETYENKSLYTEIHRV